MDNMVGQAQNVQVPNYSGVNIQIFNPSVTAPGAAAAASNVNAPNYSTNPVYPPNYYVQNLPQSPQIPTPVQTQPEEKKKTEKRDIVVLTDEYIKSIESYLNDQDRRIRLTGATEVLKRLQEDDSRKDDPALTAFVNKMLQDPSIQVRAIALAALDARNTNGDDLTKKLLKIIEDQDVSTDKGRIQGRMAIKSEEALLASGILLKMSGTTTKKEFEVKEPKVVYVSKEKKK